MTPEQALAGIGSLVAGARLVRVLAGGSVSDSYLVQRGADRWVLRIDKQLAAALGLDRSAEAAVLAQVYNNEPGTENVGPRLEHVDVEAGILLTRYIDGRAWTSDDLREPQHVERLALLLRRLHGLPLAGSPLKLRDRVARYAARAGGAEARERAARVAALLDSVSPTGPCLCHNDLVCANIIEGDRLYLIDWEYAAVGDPFFDLATVVEHHALGDELAMLLLGAYRGEVTGGDMQRLGLWREVYEHVRLLWQAAVDAPARA